MSDNRFNNNRNKLMHDSGQLKQHYKMYKAGRSWLYAGISLLTFGAGVMFSNLNVHADDAVTTTTVADSTSSVSNIQSSAVALSASTSQVSLSSSADLSASASSSQSTTEQSKVADAVSEASSSAVTSSSTADESTGLSAASSATSATTVATSSAAVSTAEASVSSAAQVSDSSVDSSGSATSSSASVQDQTSVALAQLPAGTTVETLADGTVQFDLPVTATQQDLNNAKTLLAGMNISPVVVTAKDAAGTTAWRTYSNADTSVSTVTLGNAVATPITMADLALMTAAGTGTYTDLNGKSVTDATSADLQDYYNQLVDKYGKTGLRLSIALNAQSAADFAGLMNYLSEIYYYFVGSSDSYINQLVTNLDNMTTSEQADMTQFASTSSTDLMGILEKPDGTFSDEYLMVATGNGASDAGLEDSKLEKYTMPSGMDSSFWAGVYSEFINNIVGTYISEIVPGAESYVIKNVLPAVNTVSDSQGMEASGTNFVLAAIDANSNELVHELMTIDGAYSLSTIIGHIGSMYDQIGSAVSLVINVPATTPLGEYVGAIEPGTATGWNSETFSGNAVAFPNFSMFNQLYLAYSKAIVSAAYGYAMVGKYKAIQIMYSEDPSNPDAVWTALGISDSTTPSQIDVSKIDSSIPTDDPLITQMYQQGFWDVYHYIKPFYDQGIADAADGQTIENTGDQAYTDSVWAKVDADSITDTSGDKLTTTYTGTDTTDANPHDVANYASPQTQSYLVSFYANAVAANTLSYSEQPAIETIVKDASGSIIKTNYTSLGSAITTDSNGDYLTGSFGGTIDTSNLPASVDGYEIPSDVSTITIPESGGVVYVPYAVNTVQAGQVTVQSKGAPADATFSYTVTNTEGSVVNGATEVSYGSGVEINLNDGETLNVTPSDETGYVTSVTPQSSVSFDDTVNAINTVTVVYGQQVSYTIQPTDSNGNNIGTASNSITGVSGSLIDTTQLPTVAGYTAPTFNDTDTDTTNNTPTIPTSGGVIKVAYTANEQSFTVSQMGAPSGSTAGFSYTINGGSAQTGTYGTAINAHVGDVIAILPDTITNYDASLNADTITLTANNTGSATVTYSQKNQTFTVTQTGTPTGTTGFTYTVNGGTPQNGTYGTAVLAHAGDVIVVTPGVVANYVTPATQTVTLSEDAASAISVVYMQQAQTFTVNATGIPSGTTTNFTYTINDGAAQTGTYGTAINAHVGDVIVITPGTIANYNVNPTTNALTLTNSAAGTATFAYTIATQTVAMTLNKAIVANYDGSTTAAKFLQTDIQNYSDATSNSALSWLAWGNTGIATYFNGDGSSNKAVFIAGLADMASDANFNNYFTVTSDGSLCGQYSYSLTSAGITALNALLASTTGNKYQVSFASGANTSSIFVANALIIRQNQHVYDGTSADSNASQTTAMIYYYDSGTNSIRDYSLTAGWFLPEDFVNNGNVDTSQVGTYAFSLADGNNSAKEYLTNNELNKYTTNTINPLSLDYATASFVVTPRAATVTPTITAISKVGVPTVSLTFNVPSVTGSADITSTSSIAPKYKDALISGTDYTVLSSNGVMTVTLTAAGLQKITAANPNYAITGVAGQANVSTINFQYTDSTNGNVVYTDTVYGLSSDQTSQNYSVDLTKWDGGLSYTLDPSQVATIPYTFGTNKNVTISLDHYVANVVVSVKDTNGNSLKGDQTVTLDPLDDTEGGTAANVAVDGYPTSQVSSIVFTYASGDRNSNNISELVATVNKTNNTLNVVYNYQDGRSESQTDGDMTVDSGETAGEELASMLTDSYTLFSFGASGTFGQDDESNFLGIATITVTYFAQLTATVKFVDDDEKDADGNSKDITGQDQTIIGFVGDAGQNQAINIPAGYGLASTQPDLNGNVTVSGTDASYTGVVNGDDTDNATIHLVHLTTPVDAGSTTVGTDDYAATHLALTVQVVSSDPTHLTITDGSFTRTYTRTVYVDDITGEYVGGSDWQYAGGGVSQPTASLSIGYGYNITGNIGDENTPNIKTYTNVDDLFKNWISTDGSSDITAFLANVADGGTAQLTYTANVSTNVKNNQAPSDTTDPEYENTHKTYTFTATGHIDNASGAVVAQTADNAVQTFSYERTYEVDAATGVATGNYGEWTLVDSTNVPTDIIATTKVGYKVAPETETATEIQAMLDDFQAATDTEAGTNGVDFIYTSNVTDNQAPSDSGTTTDSQTLYNETHKTFTFTATGHIGDANGVEVTQTADNAIQTFNYERTYEVDATTGEVTGNYGDWTLVDSTNVPTNIIATTKTGYKAEPGTETAAAIQAMLDEFEALTDTEAGTNGVDFIYTTNVSNIPAPSDTTDAEYANTHKTYTFTATGHIDNASGEAVTQIADNAIQTFNYERTYEVDAETGKATGNYGSWTLADSSEAASTITPTAKLGYEVAPTSYEANDINAALTNFAIDTDTTSVNDGIDFIYTTNVSNIPAPSDTTDAEYENTHKTFTFTATGHIDNVSGETVTQTADNAIQTFNYERMYEVDAATGEATGNYGAWTLVDSSNVPTDVTAIAKNGYKVAPETETATEIQTMLNTFKTATNAEDETNGVDFIYTSNVADNQAPSDSGTTTTSQTLYNETHKTYTFTATGHVDDASGAEVTQTADNAVQTFNYERTYEVDASTGEATGNYGNWTLVDPSETASTITATPKLGYKVSPDTYDASGISSSLTTFANNADTTSINDGVDFIYTTNVADVTTPINTGDPIDPSDPTGPKSDITITDADLNKTVTRQISDQYVGGPKDGESDDLQTQTATYSRTAEFDQGTGEFIGYTAWTMQTNNLTEFDAPSVENYAPTPTSVNAASDAEIATALSGDTAAVSIPTIEITYVYSGTTTTDPDGGTTVTTTDDNGNIVTIDKTWSDGDKTHVDIDTDTNVITVTETPNGDSPLAPVTINAGDVSKTGKTTVTNNEPNGVTLTHDTTDIDTDGNPTSPSNTGESISSDGTISYFKSATGDAVSVDPSDYYVTTTTQDPNGGTTDTTVDGNGKVTVVNKTWPDGDTTHVEINNETNVITVVETPNDEAPLAPVTISPNDTVKTGKTTVTDNEPDGVVLTHDTTGTDTDGNPTGPSSTGESITSNGTVSYFKSATGDAVSVSPDDYYLTTTTDDPNGGTTTTTVNGNDEVTEINKIWPDGDTTHVEIDTNTNVITVTETPAGEDPLTPVTINPNDTNTTGKTTITNNEPDGVMLTHDTTGTDTDGNPTSPATSGETVTSDGTISYFKSANGDAVSVDPAYYYTTTTTADPNGGTTITTINGNGEVTMIDKTWPDGDKTHVDIDTSTNVITVTETPNGQDPLDPATVNPGDTTQIGKTTVTNTEPNGVTLIHDTTGTDTDGKPASPSASGETVTSDGTISYFKSATGDAVSVDPADNYVTTTTNDPNGGTTTTTVNGNGEVTKIDKTWPDGDKTHVEIDTNTNVVTVTETPNGENPLAPVTIKPNDTATTGKTTVTNNEPDGVTLTHDTTGTDTDGNPTSSSNSGEIVTSDGTISYFKSANGDAVNVDPDDYYVTTTTDDPNGGTTSTTVNGNGEVTEIDKTWPDGDKTHVDIDTNTNVITVTETPNGDDPLTPVMIKPGDTTQTGKTTVTNNEPDGVTLTHDTTGTDTNGNPTSSSSVEEGVTSDGTISYLKSANGDSVSVDPADSYVTTTIDDPNGGTTSTTVNGNGEVTKIDKIWPDGDKTHVDIDTNTNVVTVTETPSGQDPLAPIAINIGDETTTGKTTITNNEPNGITLTHDGTGASTVGETITSDGTVSYFKTASGDPVSVEPTNYYTSTTIDDPNGGSTTTTLNGNGEVTTIDKTWPNGDKTHVEIDDSGTAVVTETPIGKEPLDPITVIPGKTGKTGKTGETTISNNEPDGISLSHDDTGTLTIGETIAADGTISYFKSANGEAVSVELGDYYVRDNGDGQQTKPSTSTGTATATTTTSGSNDVQASGAQTDANGNKVTDTAGRIETNESATNANKSGKANGKLPQTSEAQNEVDSLGLIGLAISLIGLAGTRKKKRKEDQ